MNSAQQYFRLRKERGIPTDPDKKSCIPVWGGHLLPGKEGPRLPHGERVVHLSGERVL